MHRIFSGNACSMDAGEKTDVACPDCKEGTLMPRFTCFRAWLVCPSCKARFELTDLATKLSDEDFEHLAHAIGHRYANRV